MTKKNPGYGTAVLILVGFVALGYFFLLKPAKNSLVEERQRVDDMTKELSDSRTVKIEANEGTIRISKAALMTSRNEAREFLRDVGVPDSSIGDQGNGLSFVYQDRPDRVGAVISGLTGSTYIDSSGQIVGGNRVFKVKFKVKGAGDTSILEGVVAPPK